MSKIAIQGNASGTGTLTIAAPNTNTDRTLTLPDATGTLNTSGAVNEVPAGSASTPAIYPTGDSNTGIFFPAADTIAAATGGTERLRIDSSGNVGIGTSSPDYRLQIEGPGTGVTSRIGITNTTTGSTLEVGSDGNGGFMATSGAYGNLFYTNGSERARIDSSGNVGIGTSTIEANTNSNTLEIAGKTSSGAAIIRLKTGDRSTAKTMLFCDTGGFEQRVETAHPIVFSTNNTERARIDSSGNLLVGTTGANGRLCVYNTNQSLDWGMRVATVEDAVGTNNFYYVDFRKNDTTQTGYIWSNGGTTTSYATSSDYRLKENIAPMTGALEKVAALKPSTWNWKANGQEGQGFIAHELQAVCPDAVSGEKDGLDKDGNPWYQAVDTSFLVATLTAAIQELNAKVEAQAAEIAALKGQA